MISKLIQFQNGLKGFKKRNLNTKSKNDKRESKNLKELQKERRRVTFIH